MTKAHRSSRHRSVKRQSGRDADRQCAVRMKKLLLGERAAVSILPGEPGPRPLANVMKFVRAAECAVGRRHGGLRLTIVCAYFINARLLECVDYLIGHIISHPSCIDSPEFRQLPAGYRMVLRQHSPHRSPAILANASATAKSQRKQMPRIPTG